MVRLTRDGTAEPLSQDQYPGANGDREIFIFPVQLTTSRIGNLTRLILIIATCDDYAYIHTFFGLATNTLSVRNKRSRRVLTKQTTVRTIFALGVENEQVDADWDGRTPSGDTKLSGAISER